MEHKKNKVQCCNVRARDERDALVLGSSVSILSLLHVSVALQTNVFLFHQLQYCNVSCVLDYISPYRVRVDGTIVVYHY